MPDVQRTFFAAEHVEASPCPNAKQKKPPAEKQERPIPRPVAAWLTRMTRIQAHTSYIVRLFRHPEIAGGQSLAGDTYSERAARYDQTLLHDAFLLVRDEADLGVVEVQAAMDAAKRTAALPGSKAKVEEMIARARRGQSIFVDEDATHG